MSDVLGFYGDDFDGIEFSEGIAFQDVLPDQAALLKFEDVEFRRVGEKLTPELRARVRLDEKHAKSRKKSFFMDIWLTQSEGAQRLVDGYCVAAGLGPLTVRFGGATGPRDARPQMRVDSPAADGNPPVPSEEIEANGRALAAALKGRSWIGGIQTERQPGRADKNVIQGMYRASEENIAAIEVAGYEYGGITRRERTLPNGRKQGYLVAKTGGAPAKAAHGGGTGAPAKALD